MSKSQDLPQPYMVLPENFPLKKTKEYKSVCILHLKRYIPQILAKDDTTLFGLNVFISNSQFYKARQISYIKQQRI